MMAGGAAANGSVTQQPVPSDSPRGPNGINGLAQIRTKVPGAAPQHRLVVGGWRLAVGGWQVLLAGQLQIVVYVPWPLL